MYHATDICFAQDTMISQICIQLCIWYLNSAYVTSHNSTKMLRIASTFAALYSKRFVDVPHCTKFIYSAFYSSTRN